MEYKNSKWLKIAPNSIKITQTNNKLVINNLKNKPGFAILNKLFFSTTNKIHIQFKGKKRGGDNCEVKILNRKKDVLASAFLNSEVISEDLSGRLFIVIIFIPGNSSIEIDSVQIDTEFNEEELTERYFQSKTLLISPGYPSENNKYLCGFVHTRVKAYIREGWGIDVAWISDNKFTTIYEYEGIKIFKSNYYNLRRILQKKYYEKILIHFFDEKYANVLDSCDLTRSKLYFFLHGAETLYWDWNKMTSPYFRKNDDFIDTQQIKEFKHKDYIIKKYNELENVKWVFVTPWTKKRSEELIGIKYKNFETIPCFIDDNLFKFQLKSKEQRKKIFVLRKFDNINTYSIDLVVRTILELSRREYFDNLEFNIYGDGMLFDLLLAPIRNLKNVKLHKGFLNHEQIKKVHDKNGIAFFPTRFDSQAVSSCEAASSGCVVVSSKNPGVEQYILPKYDTLGDGENYSSYANIIEELYFNPDRFLKISKLMAETVTESCGYKATIEKELKMYIQEKRDSSLKLMQPVKQPVLTIVVPSYNVEKYLRHTVISLLNHPNAYKIEILIINDGSTDRTEQIAMDLEKLSKVGKKQIVRLINKENGGHGSTINLGIQEAKGKYLKIVDGDDTVDSKAFCELIDILETEDVDIVLNDYVEDYAKSNTWNVPSLYNFLSPGVKYFFDDLCHPNYGFDKWGPLLSTSSYKTKMLQDAGFKLSEKCFYVDMELNAFITLFAQTIKYYPLPVYRYLLGTSGQSVSRRSYTKNYKHHENVTINLIKIFINASGISEEKKHYLLNKLIIPMIKTQYSICLEYFNNVEPFREFESKLKEYQFFYYHDEILKIKNINYYRKTGGYFIFINKLENFVLKVRGILNNIIYRK